MAIGTPSTGTRPGTYGVTWETVGTPSFEFRLAHRRLDLASSTDEGATVELHGRDGDDFYELLKFDCFEAGPHWHRCRTGQPDEVAAMDGGSMDADLDFAIETLRDRFRPLVDDQGFDRWGSAAHGAEIESALPLVEGRLRQMIRDRGPAQVVAPPPRPPS